MTITLTRTAPPAPVLPEPRFDCEGCGDDFPERETEFYEPRQERLCLDCVDAELTALDDRRAADHYYYR